MIFKQLFDTKSSTYTYFLADATTKEAVLIDPVDSQIEVYLALLASSDYLLKYSLETHVHADHVTASGDLRNRTQAQTGVSQKCGAVNASLQLNDGDILQFGRYALKVIATPGHTAGSVSYMCKNRLFTGDALLINGCGRTDFQGGSARMLFDSITQKIFTLPDETLIYPAHDYSGKRVSCVGQEKTINPRLAGKNCEEFLSIMNNLKLPKPKLIDIAVPANRMCGVTEEMVQQG